MKAVAILGAGPAGLMAAHACALKGVPFAIFAMGKDDVPTKSVIGGAQFLHKAVPMLNDDEPDATIKYMVHGTASGYQAKVYAGDDVPFVSFNNVKNGQEVPAWSLQKTYDTLWHGIAGDGSSLNVETVDARTVQEWLEEDKFAHIISTIPKPDMCLTYQGYVDVPHPHVFVSQKVRIVNAPMLPFENAIVYDGTKHVSWYRTSRLFGFGSTEWGEGASSLQLPYSNVVVAKKPIRTDCHCFDGQVVFTGRFGAWKKGILTHHAFVDTWKALDQ